MNTVIEHIVNAIKAGNLTFEERLAVVQDVGIIKKYYKSDRIDLLNGLTKIKEAKSRASRKLIKENSLNNGFTGSFEIIDRDDGVLIPGIVNQEGFTKVDVILGAGVNPEDINSSEVAAFQSPDNTKLYFERCSPEDFSKNYDNYVSKGLIPIGFDAVTYYQTIEEFNVAMNESKNLPTHVVKFNNYVATSVKVLREELAEKLMKPIFEAELEKGESESDSDFKKRAVEQDKIQSKNVDEFEKAQEKMKKGESKPLAKALRSKGMSQQELADQLDVHKSTISRIKTGKRNPSFEMMTELGDALGSVENLFPELK